MPAASPVAFDEQLVDGIASVILALKLVQPLSVEVGLVGGGPSVVLGDRVDEDHVRQARGPVVVLGGLVGGGGDHGDAVAVGVVDRVAGERSSC